MANKEEDFAPYFKIRWAKRSAWTLEQAAYLSCGKDPDSKAYEIAVAATNPVSKRYYWLVNKLKKEYLQVVDVVDGIEYFNTGSLLRLLEQDKKKFVVDKEMRRALDHMYKAPYGVDYTKFVSRAVYREAGRLVYQQYPDATKREVASAIKDLPTFFNNEEHGHIEAMQLHQIEEYLKGLGDLTGKPKTAEKPQVIVNLAQLVEQL